LTDSEKPGGADKVAPLARAPMKGSAEFSTWVALLGAVIGGGLCAIFSTSLLFLIPAALVGAGLAYKAEGLGRSRLERYLDQRRSR
jgi:hypothetical protein